MKYLTLLAGAVAIASAPIHADNLFVTNTDTNTVTVINTFTQNQIDLIDVFDLPIDAFVTPDQSQVWITQDHIPPDFTAGIQVIDAQTRLILATITPANIEYEQVAFSPDSAFAYVLNFTNDTIDIYSTANFTLQTSIPVPISSPLTFAITPDGTTAYVTNASTTIAKITGIDTPTPASTTFTVPNASAPRQVGITPDGTKIYFPTDSADLSIQFYFANLPISNNSDIVGFDIASQLDPESRPVFTQDSSSFYGGAFANDIYQIATADNSLLATDIGADDTVYLTLGILGQFLYTTTGVAPNQVNIVDTTTNTDAGIFPLSGVGTGLVAVAEPFTIFTAQSLRNRSILQYELYNRVTWTVPFPISWTPQLYLIYRDAALTDLAFAEPASTGNRVFNDQGRTRGVTYEYYLVAVDTNDITHILGMTSVTSQ